MQLTIRREFITNIGDKNALKMIFIVLFNQENRIRVLERKSPITRAQFIALLKGL